VQDQNAGHFNPLIGPSISENSSVNEYDQKLKLCLQVCPFRVHQSNIPSGIFILSPLSPTPGCLPYLACVSVSRNTVYNQPHISQKSKSNFTHKYTFVPTQLSNPKLQTRTHPVSKFQSTIPIVWNQPNHSCVLELLTGAS